MTLLDLTIVNIAIPSMITKLHASFDDVLWVINAYALILAVLVITCGRLGDFVGPRIMFGWGVAVFTAASAACGLAPSPGWLLAAFLLAQWLRQDREPLVPFALFRDRNFSVMNFVSGTLVIGMMGIFLPFTIYLQSVLGFSALKAGLAMAPASVVSVFVAPVAGRMTDKIGGKYILMTGLTLFAVGMGATMAIAQTTSTWYDF